MSFQVNVPPSVAAKIEKSEKGDDVEETETTGKRREDWRKLKELEEARKAGTAPAMQDEEGKDINPHIPQYIMQAPWYFGSTVPTLRHQRQQEEHLPTYTGVGQWYKRGVKEGTVTTKFRKGACENCGAMTHKKKDCLERPRKVGAKFTGEDLAADEHLQPTLNFDYVGKRDRWNGYDTSEHKKIYEDYQKIEVAKSYLKSKNIEEALLSGEINEKEAKEIQEQEEEYDDDDKYADDMDMPGQKMDSKQRITVRNLRIREDIAKYLYNLDVNSAYYDPKTRSMRENPFSNISQEPNQLPYAGDNFVRWSGDSYNIAKRQQFAWEAYEKGADVHLQGDPTKLELLAKQYKKKKEEYKTNIKESIMDKYGGEEHLEAPPKQLLLAQSEDYVEYSRHGTVIKGQEKAKVKSKYEEDVFINNHTSVWGSFWNNGRWGFQCCHSCIKESYCTGEAGKQAASGPLLPFNEVKKEAEIEEVHSGKVKSGGTGKASFFMKNEDWERKEKEQKSLKTEKDDTGSEDSSSSDDDSEEEKKRIKKKKEAKARRREKKRAKRKKEKLRRKKKKRARSESSSSGSESEDEDQAKERRLKEALKAETLRVREVDRLMKMDERKRPYNSMYDVKGPTEEEIEAFNRKRSRADDPMGQFL